MDLAGADLNIGDLKETSSRFRRQLSSQLTESLQRHLDEALGEELGVRVRVEVQAVALRNPAN